MSLMEEKESIDVVLAEVREIKDSLAAKFDYDIDKMWADLKKKEAASGREILKAPAKPRSSAE